MSRTLDDADIEAIKVLISTERLATLTKLTGEARIAVELHQETLNLGASLMCIIASIELALRNTVSENLTAYFNFAGWLTHPPSQFKWRAIENQNAQKAIDSARRSEYSKMNQAEKAALDIKAFPNGRPAHTTHMRRAMLRRKQIDVSDGKVIAETTMYFWKRLYSAEYEQTLWRTTLKKSFPNKKITRAIVAEKLEHIYQARNRLAHHEPVLYKRFDDTIEAISFLCKNLNHAVPTEYSPLAKLIDHDLDEVNKKAYQLHQRLQSFRKA
jgi:hypothetical protein